MTWVETIKCTTNTGCGNVYVSGLLPIEWNNVIIPYITMNRVKLVNYFVFRSTVMGERAFFSRSFNNS